LDKALALFMWMLNEFMERCCELKKNGLRVKQTAELDKSTCENRWVVGMSAQHVATCP